MWPIDKALNLYFVETADSHVCFLSGSLHQPNLPAAPGWSITFKVASFPSLGITAPDTPVERVRCWQSTGGHPLVLPCPVHGPVWTKPQWIHVILVLFSSCLASPRSPLGETLTSQGDRKDICLSLQRAMLRNGGHCIQWVRSRERTTASSVWSLMQG